MEDDHTQVKHIREEQTVIRVGNTRGRKGI